MRSSYLGILTAPLWVIAGELADNTLTKAACLGTALVLLIAGALAEIQQQRMENTMRARVAAELEKVRADLEARKAEDYSGGQYA